MLKTIHDSLLITLILPERLNKEMNELIYLACIYKKINAEKQK